MEQMIPIVAIMLGIGGPVLVVYFFLNFSSKANAKKMDTLVKIVELGGAVDPKMMGLLSQTNGPAQDLRKGLIWLAIGIPLTLALTLVIGEENWQVGIFGLIPVFIGIAYLIMVKYGDKDSTPG